VALIPVNWREFFVQIAGDSGRFPSEPCLYPGVHTGTRAEATEIEMGRGLLLWLIGIPLPIILVVWLLGGLN
jgi:hypothetical protein